MLHLFFTEISYILPIHLLGAGELNRAMVDDTVGLVAVHLAFLIAYRLVVEWRIGQVERFARLAVGVERGIALGGCLHNLVFGREEVHRILTGPDIRPDDNTLLVHEGGGGSDGIDSCRINDYMRQHRIDFADGEVGRNMHQLGDIVALQFQNHL